MQSKHNNMSFTLMELSIVIVIMSIIFSLILLSKKLIELAKVNKIYEEYRNFTYSISIFKDSYGCLPGDCPPIQIPDLTGKISSVCTTLNTTMDNSHVYNEFSTRGIESATKRTCMFQELQAAGYLPSSPINIQYNSSNTSSTNPLTDSIAGSTIPLQELIKK